MAREFAKSFYKSAAWKRTRDSYFRFRNGLCERCLRVGRIRPGEIVHHKIHLSPETINNPEIALGFNNLELVCRDCHAKEHPEIYGRIDDEPSRVSFDADGNIVKPDRIDLNG